TSTEDEIRITAKKKITLNGGGSYFTLEQGGIESGTAGDHKVKSAHYEYSGPATQTLEMATLSRLSEHETKSVRLSDFSA
ncbi:DUF2345 domain-containing protein, partial [Pseudomonas sp. 18173]|uniref:DUF2345 domain-containing protein n=1 Tax=Pseudomonas sp. 18173 TaxID=3390055 RepID=UPI003D213488